MKQKTVPEYGKAKQERQRLFCVSPIYDKFAHSLHQPTTFFMINVAIVSHGHQDLLIQSRLGGLLDTANLADVRIWVKDNSPSPALAEFCQQHQVNYTAASPGMGFGENNNYLFDLVCRSEATQDKDFFILMNPDITLDLSVLKELTSLMRKDQVPIATLNLYRDEALTQPDANVRRFPSWHSILRMLAVRSISQPYDKSQLNQACHLDWASGALMAFEIGHYRNLRGFDSRYFMYFEDVDICYRSQKLLGKGIRYYPQLVARHKAAHQNRNLISPHAGWFFRSFLQFLSLRYLVYDRQPKITPHPSKSNSK